MPKYTYKCTECDAVYSVRHRMSERLTNCDACKSNNTLVRVISNIVLEPGSDFTTKEPGHIVKKTIEDLREEIRTKKEELTQNGQ